MNFSFNEEQRGLGLTVASVLADHPLLTGPEPIASSDADVWKALAELGLFSLPVSEKHGGLGLPLVDLALAVEAMGAGLAPPIVASTLAATLLIEAHGSEELKDAVLPAVGGGRTKIALAVAERGNGNLLDPATRMEGRALSGAKIAVEGANDADAFLVICRGPGGPCLAFVNRAAKGLTIRAHASLDPSAALGHVRFDNVSIDASELLSHPAAVETFIDYAATFEALLSMGIAARMHEAAVEYAKTRQQFGQPIGAFQTIKHRCADLAVSVEAGRATVYYASWACTSGDPDRALRASAAKAYCSEIARNVCNEAIQIHGGMGFTWELGLHRFLRRSRLLLSSLGSPAWHYARVHDERAAELASGNASRRDAA